VRFRVELLEDSARGYVCENYGQPFQLPDLGPIGANGLANARDFLAPVAFFEDCDEQTEVSTSSAATCGRPPTTTRRWTWWPGTAPMAPYVYDLRRFQCAGLAQLRPPGSVDLHGADLAVGHPGLAGADFVVFAPRWLVGEDTFRPPYFHRNVMSEFNGPDRGRLRREGRGLRAGRRLSAQHDVGPRTGPGHLRQGEQCRTRPQKVDDGLAFMFETRLAPVVPTEFALAADHRQDGYDKVWEGLERNFRL